VLLVSTYWSALSGLPDAPASARLQPPAPRCVEMSRESGRQWLKSIHLIVSVIWLGAAIAMMIYAPLFLAGWDRTIESISKVEGLLALQNPVYLQARMLYTASGVTFIAVLILLSVLSTPKPWTRQDRIRAVQPKAGTSPA
jgi:hypothetical protein